MGGATTGIRGDPEGASALSTYRSALERYAGARSAAALRRVQGACRAALAAGLPVHVLARVHHTVMLQAAMSACANSDARGTQAVHKMCSNCPLWLNPCESARASGNYQVSWPPQVPAYCARRLEESTRHLRHVEFLRDEEERRVARTLHDSPVQYLAAIHLALGELGVHLPPSGAAALRKTQELLDELEAQLRCLSHEIRPALLDNAGLVAALRQLALGLSAKSGIPVAVTGDDGARGPALVESMMYRISSEALVNAIRHARPSHVAVLVAWSATSVICTIADDGSGFDMNTALARGTAGGLGIAGMRERASVIDATLTFRSGPQCGTVVTAEARLSCREAVLSEPAREPWSPGPACVRA